MPFFKRFTAGFLFVIATTSAMGAIPRLTSARVPVGVEIGSVLAAPPFKLTGLSPALVSQFSAAASEMRPNHADRLIMFQGEGHLVLTPYGDTDETSRAIIAPVDAGGNHAAAFPILSVMAENLGNYRFYTETVKDPEEAEQALSRAFDALRVYQREWTSPVDLYEEMRRRWIHDAEYGALLDTYGARRGEHVGKLPRPLARTFGGEPQALGAIDQIARDPMSHYDEKNNWVEGKSADVVSQSVVPIAVTRLNEGDDGVVYRLRLERNSYALKVYKGGSVISEFRALTFLAAQGAKDIMKSYVMKFSNEPMSDVICWILSEFIPTRPALTLRQWQARGERTIAEIARESGIYIGYGHDRVRSILVDAGFIRARRDSVVDEKDYLRALESCADHLRNALAKAKQ